MWVGLLPGVGEWGGALVTSGKCSIHQCAVGLIVVSVPFLHMFE